MSLTQIPHQNRTVCRNFARTGTCTFGNRCRFLHVENVIRTPTISSNPAVQTWQKVDSTVKTTSIQSSIPFAPSAVVEEWPALGAPVKTGAQSSGGPLPAITGPIATIQTPRIYEMPPTPPITIPDVGQLSLNSTQKSGDASRAFASHRFLPLWAHHGQQAVTCDNFLAGNCKKGRDCPRVHAITGPETPQFVSNAPANTTGAYSVAQIVGLAPGSTVKTVQDLCTWVKVPVLPSLVRLRLRKGGRGTQIATVQDNSAEFAQKLVSAFNNLPPNLRTINLRVEVVPQPVYAMFSWIKPDVDAITLYLDYKSSPQKSANDLAVAAEQKLTDHYSKVQDNKATITLLDPPVGRANVTERTILLEGVPSHLTMAQLLQIAGNTSFRVREDSSLPDELRTFLNSNGVFNIRHLDRPFAPYGRAELSLESMDKYLAIKALLQQADGSEDVQYGAHFQENVAPSSAGNKKKEKRAAARLAVLEEERKTKDMLASWMASLWLKGSSRLV